MEQTRQSRKNSLLAFDFVKNSIDFRRGIEFHRGPFIEILHEDIDSMLDGGIDARVVDAMAPSPMSLVRSKLPFESSRKVPFDLGWFPAWELSFPR